MLIVLLLLKTPALPFRTESCNAPKPRVRTSILPPELALGVGKAVWIFTNGRRYKPLTTLDRREWVKRHVLASVSNPGSGLFCSAVDNLQAVTVLQCYTQYIIGRANTRTSSSFVLFAVVRVMCFTSARPGRERRGLVPHLRQDRHLFA